MQFASGHRRTATSCAAEGCISVISVFPPVSRSELQKLFPKKEGLNPSFRVRTSAQQSTDFASRVPLLPVSPNSSRIQAFLPPHQTTLPLPESCETLRHPQAQDNPSTSSFHRHLIVVVALPNFHIRRGVLFSERLFQVTHGNHRLLQDLLFANSVHTLCEKHPCS